jgi:hypothetical protein
LSFTLAFTTIPGAVENINWQLLSHMMQKKQEQTILAFKERGRTHWWSCRKAKWAEASRQVKTTLCSADVSAEISADVSKALTRGAAQQRSRRQVSA